MIRHIMAVLLLLGGAGAFAQSGPSSADGVPPLEDLLKQGLSQVPQSVHVSTAGRFAQGSDQAPAVTYVLTDQDIRVQGMRDIADVLRSLPGLYTSSNGNFTYLGARGLGRPGDFNSRVLVLIDGVRINENMTDAALLGPEFLLDVDLIERVEFTPGPGSALYGNNAFWGVVNVITKRGDKLHGLGLRAAIDSLRGREVMASIGHRFEQGGEIWLALTSYEQLHREPAYYTPPQYLQQARALNDSRGYRLVGGINVSGWSMRWGWSDRDAGFPLPVHMPTGVELYRSPLLMKNGFVSTAYEGQWGGGWDVGFEASVKTTQLERSDFWFGPGDVLARTDTRSLGGVANVGMRLGRSIGRQHYLLAGVELQRDYRQKVYVKTNVYGEGDYGSSSKNQGLFVQDVWRLSPEHSLVLGLRADRDERVEGINLHPRLAWMWTAREGALLRLNYGSAYRAANVYEFLINANWGNSAPEPERIRNLELSWEQRISPQLQYRASWYRADIRHLITLTEGPAQIYVNGTPIRSEGVELGLERRWPQGSRIQASLTLQRSLDHQGEALDNSPKALLKLAYSRPLTDTLQFGWQMQAMSHRISPLGRLPGYALNHVSLRWETGRLGQWQAGLYNIGNVRYYDASEPGQGRMRQEGRVLRLSYSQRFGS